MSTALVDSIVFSNLTPSTTVKSRLRRMRSVESNKNIYPTKADFATLCHKPEQTLRAIEAQQMTSTNQDETTYASAIAKRVASVGRALGLDSRSPEAITRMVGLLSALGSASRQLDRISQKRKKRESESEDEL